MMLSQAHTEALRAFHPTLPGMWAFDRERPSYALLCQLRRRGLALCDPPTPHYRAQFRYSWRLTGAGERARAELAQ
jgi:hypothetical protein